MKLKFIRLIGVFVLVMNVLNAHEYSDKSLYFSWVPTGYDYRSTDMCRPKLNHAARFVNRYNTLQRPSIFEEDGVISYITSALNTCKWGGLFGEDVKYRNELLTLREKFSKIRDIRSKKRIAQRKIRKQREKAREKIEEKRHLCKSELTDIGLNYMIMLQTVDDYRRRYSAEYVLNRIDMFNDLRCDLTYKEKKSLLKIKTDAIIFSQPGG